jgi:hypothetical protein
MNFTPEFLAVFFPILSIWNYVFAPLALYLVFTDKFTGWSKLSRFGFSVSCVGMLSEPLMHMAGIDTGKNPYWSLKDFGLGIICLGFAIQLLPYFSRIKK